MTHTHGLRNKVLRTVALNGCVLGLWLLASATALAGYNPKNPSKPKTATGSWASRGCDTQANEAITTPQARFTLLAPREYVGVTASTHPTFVWFVPEEKTDAVEFILFEYTAEKGKGNPIWRTKLPSSPGMMSFELPQDQPGLAMGKAYVWQVTLMCSKSASRPSRNLWMEAVIQVAPLPGELNAALAKTTDAPKRAELYGQAGFWYEALAETLKSPAAKPFRQTLLADLARLEVGDQKARLESVRAIAP